MADPIADALTAVATAVTAERFTAASRIADLEAQVEQLRPARTLYAAASATGDGSGPEAPTTLADAATRLRDGKGDSLLLRRGDTFDGGPIEAWNKSGAAADARMTVGDYGPPEAPMPKVVARRHGLLIGPGSAVRYVRLRNVHLVPGTDAVQGDRYGVWVRGSVSDFVMEGVRVERFHNNVSFSGDAWNENVAVRRCIILDSIPGSGSNVGQGMYAARTRGLVIEDSVFDHNGWVGGGKRNAERHNLYLAGLFTKDRTEALNAPATVRHNFFGDGSAYGAMVRCGGIVEDNLAVDNALHFLASGEAANVVGNVALGGGNVNVDDPRGFGISLEGNRMSAHGNIVANKPTTNPNNGAAFMVSRGDHWDGPINAEMVGNVVDAWFGNGLEVASPTESVAFAANAVAVLGSGRKVVSLKAMPGLRSMADNLYHHGGEPPARWFTANAPTEKRYGLAAWSALTGDQSRAGAATYPDAGRVPTAEMRAQLRAGTLAPADCLRWVREGFGR